MLGAGGRRRDGGDEGVAAVSEAAVEAALKRVVDPEVGLNIVDLGLVYGIEVGEGGDVDVTMTLTTPGCPLHEAIDGAVQRALESVPGVRSVRVHLVWWPPWSPDMITAEGRRALGLD
jgi:metal-sulfur cluster biosynthetic enzyme